MSHRLPAISDGYRFADVGGLLYYGLDRAAQDRLAATYVDKILKGAKSADLPIEQPTTFELVVNAKTAKSLGLNLSYEIVLRANKVIE